MVIISKFSIRKLALFWSFLKKPYNFGFKIIFESQPLKLLNIFNLKRPGFPQLGKVGGVSVVLARNVSAVLVAACTGPGVSAAQQQQH
jgi:hypothetical protein